MQAVKSIQFVLYAILFLVSFTTTTLTAEEIFLKDNLAKAKPGDYIVTCQNRVYTVLHINSKANQFMTIEEISISANKIPSLPFNWKQWIANQALGHTSWVLYTIDLNTGAIIRSFSFQLTGYKILPQSQNFLSTLLTLKLDRIPDKYRKKVGPVQADGSPDWRQYWQPRMIVEGQNMKNVAFGAWKTTWPKDGSELSGSTIEIYIPEPNQPYASYFPYWLEIKNSTYKTKLHIVDSGTGMQSPASAP